MKAASRAAKMGCGDKNLTVPRKPVRVYNPDTQEPSVTFPRLLSTVAEAWSL